MLNSRIQHKSDRDYVMATSRVNTAMKRRSHGGAKKRLLSNSFYAVIEFCCMP